MKFLALVTETFKTPGTRHFGSKEAILDSTHAELAQSVDDIARANGQPHGARTWAEVLDRLASLMVGSWVDERPCVPMECLVPGWDTRPRVRRGGTWRHHQARGMESGNFRI